MKDWQFVQCKGAASNKLQTMKCTVQSGNISYRYSWYSSTWWHSSRLSDLWPSGYGFDSRSRHNQGT